MKKIILLVPLILLSSVENVDAMYTYRKSMKKMYARKSGRKYRKNINKTLKRKRKIGRKKASKKKKLNFIDSLVESLHAPKKMFSISSLVSKIDDNKDFLSTLLLLYVVFGQLLSKQQVECWDPFNGYRWNPFPSRWNPFAPASQTLAGRRAINAFGNMHNNKIKNRNDFLNGFTIRTDRHVPTSNWKPCNWNHGF
ncbi:hypothetical protein ACFLYU_04480 [Candidatus Dependentiae bacterium]